MIEIPEAQVLARQANHHLAEKKVQSVTAWQNPHKLAFIYGDPATYGNLFQGKTFQKAQGFGSWVELDFEDSILAVSEGTRLLFTTRESTVPRKHQMLLRFTDGSWLCAAVRMYGAVVGARHGEYDNDYYRAARQKPAVFSPDFSLQYFTALINREEHQSLSLKAFLATEQRIPGLGNGVLQDILFNAGLHPRKKIKSLSASEKKVLYPTLVSTLKDMADRGGRDTEDDLLGNPGEYQTRMSRHTVGTPCPRCQTPVTKAAYLGGSIYFCPTCQPV